MCGIAGIIGSSDVDVVGRMLSKIAHRGPDDQGLERFGELPNGRAAVLGHRRLSIIDVSTRGHQPMSNEDRTVWVVCNGEIYNFRALRTALQDAGHVFQSKTDSEVLIHGYEEWGVGLLDRLIGMFAFALLDTKSGELLLARDRLGIKPVYYTKHNGGFAFASEMKALLEVPGMAREIDPQALDAYLMLGYVPGPRTLFRGITKLQPGCLMRIGERMEGPKKYWSLPDANPRNESFEEQTEQFSELLDCVIGEHLVSDVPLGSFLSGGLDSSMITALMMRHRSGGPQLQTFCLGYGDRRHRHDERDAAAEIAGHLHTRHSEIVCEDSAAIDMLPALVWHVDEPIAEGLLAPFALLCRRARQDVTVILSGEGADELLFGYRYYGLEEWRRRCSVLPGPLRSAVGGALHRMVSRDGARSRALGCCLEDTPLASFVEWSTIFPAVCRTELYGDALRHCTTTLNPAELFGGATGRANGDSIHIAPMLDARYRMVDYILSKNDKLSMAVGLEIRVPFLDHRVIEFLAGVPVSHKIHGSRNKRLLRSAASTLLPAAVAERRKKPFAAPLGEWLPVLVSRYMRPSLLAEDGVLNDQALDTLVRRALRDGSQHAKLWVLLILEIWYRIYIRQDSATLDRVAEENSSRHLSMKR